MEINAIQKRAGELILKKKLHFKISSAEDNAILAHTVKLNEEVGELCNDILSILKLQRSSKLENFEKKNMYAEFADVLITLVQLASLAHVNMERAVSDKLKVLQNRSK